MDSLNHYVMMQIFDYLDAASLKCCTETCKSWSKMITSSYSTMKKLPLSVDSGRIGSQNEKMCEIRRLKRQYHTLIVEDVKFTTKLLSPLKSQASHIKHIELIHVDFTAASWKQLLQNLTTIEKMTIVASRITNKLKSVKEEKINMPTLKSLTFIDSEWSLFEFVGETSIDDLKFHNQQFSPSDVVHFFPFLKLQAQLTSLAVRVQTIFFYKMLMNDDENTYKFRLKTLSINFKNWSDESYGQSLIEFLEQHKDSLEVLEVDCKLNEKIHEYIFTKLKLKTLTINASYLPNESPVFYQSLRPNTHLKKLFLTGELNGSVETQGIFNVYRDINDLTIQNWSSGVVNDALVTIINNLTKIKQLKIPYLVENTTELAMPTLKLLCIESVPSNADFQTFILNQTNVENLYIKWIYKDINDAIGLMTARLKNLKYLVCGPGFKPTIETLRALKENSKNLECLEVYCDPKAPLADGLLDEINGKGMKMFQYNGEAAGVIFPVEKLIWHDIDMRFIPMSSIQMSDDSDDDLNDDYDDDSDDDYDFYDSDDHNYFDDPFFYNSSDSELDFEQIVIRDIMGFFMH